MNHDYRPVNVKESDAPSPSDAWIFAQQLLGKPIARPPREVSAAGIDHEHLSWLASVSPDSIDRLRDSLREEHDPTVERSQLEWLADVSSRHENQLRCIRILEAAAKELQSRSQRFEEGSNLQEAQWDPGKHPRRGGAPNAGWFATTGGSGGSTRAGGSSSFFDAVIRRNQTVADLTGRQTPGMAQSSRLAADLQSATRLPGEVARAAAAGLGTGAKAVVNASATAVKNVATLGLSTSQLELIGVTKEDRARGYDTAVTIATASGEVLIAVGTAGIASALSKGGSVANGFSGALIAYDAAGNAVGVVRGTYDASKNGVNLNNGAQVAAGALGLGANVSAARGLGSSATLPKGFDPAKGFATFEDFKEAFGSAGDGQAWHHVVEQTINSGKFAAELLHNPANLLKLPHGKGTIHAKVSGYYSSKIPGITGDLTVREWVSKKTFKQQFDFGIESIKKAGGSQFLPPHLR